MKRLLIATDNFLPRWDGIARFLSEIIPRLKDNYEITVVAPDFGPYDNPDIKLVKIPLSKVFKVGDFRITKFKHSIIDNLVKNSDLVFSQTIGPIGYCAIQSSKRHKKPISSFIHSIEWELVPKAMSNILLKKYSQIIAKYVARKLYNKCNLIIVPSANTEELLKWNNIRSKYQIVYLGVDTNKFVPATSEEKQKIRSDLGYDENDIIIGYHGRISREKDLITLLRAFTRLQWRYKNIHLLIVGDGLESIKKQFSRRNIRLVGSKDNPIPYLQAMDIYCLTSLTETTCLSTLEAMSCGLPVVSTEVGFIRSYIKNNVNGLFFQKQNPYHLARQVQKIIENPQLKQKLSENARKSVSENFSWDKTAKGIREALKSIEK